MVKQKKEETAELMISIEQFTRTRDSVVVSLTNLQNGLQHVQAGINDLLRTYMNHTTSILAGGSGALDSLALTNPMTTVGGTTEGGPVAQPLVDGSAKRKRKREKKERDPNAPKRPLTAAFLYSQHARPIVRSDLEAALQPGEKLEPNAVNMEVNKRWNEMHDDAKELWRQSYRKSMEEYKEAMKEYAAARGGVTSPIPDVHDDEITDEVDAGALDTDAEGTSGEESDEDVPAKAPSPPPKVPSPPAAKTPRANKRQKVGKTNGVLAPAPATAPSPIPVPIPTMLKPTSILPPGNSPVVENAAQPKEKGKKVKGSKEPSPEESKKKRTARKVKGGDEETEAAPVESAPPVEKKKRDRKRKNEGTTA
ncbi:hypothetical protein AOQ84DRAFT_356086 [Glonium stellatum]|uniref:HMG box domain-containing protein n=1 Tax=Glonium stellatum TaxID=574774 RepID=A0A8E2JPS3_9PEZI|nr:hypothetical protein AOQ84DRAFT_356086 [Glonium stellatum]